MDVIVRGHHRKCPCDLCDGIRNILGKDPLGSAYYEEGRPRTSSPLIPVDVDRSLSSYRELPSTHSMVYKPVRKDPSWRRTVQGLFKAAYLITGIVIRNIQNR